MKRTGLPYDMSEMDEIKNNGAIVDMSDIKFPGIPRDKIQRTTFIFFRNTGFDIKLDFSKCPFEVKQDFLISYLIENIDVKQNEFATSYVKIFNRVIGNDVNVECILTDKEIDIFVKNNDIFVSALIQFIISLPVFAMFYFSLNDEVYNMDDFVKTDENLITDNFYHIIAADGFLSLFDIDINMTPLFYDQIFTFENVKLLHAVEELPFFSILHGLCIVDTEMWEMMIKTSDALNTSINK